MADKSRYSIGIDVGASNIRCGVVDDEGRVLKSNFMPSWQFDTVAGNIDHLKVLLDELMSDFDRDAFHYIGMGLPGTVDDSRGMVVYTPNLCWFDVPITAILREHTGLPVHLVQDTGAAVWGEYLYGAGRGSRNVVCATIGSGVACGIVVGGQLYGGAGHTAGEIGHLHMVDDGLPCGCGAKGCLEAYASGFGLVKMYHAGLGQAGEPPLPGEVTARDIFEAARQGSAYCLALIDTMARYLARGFAAMATVLAPEIFLVSGGLSRETELLFEPVKRYFYEYAYHKTREHTRFMQAALGPDAPLVGAAALYLAPEYA